jgi:hypothetical protein
MNSPAPTRHHLSKSCFRSLLAAFLHRWFRIPTTLERLLARKVEGCHSGACRSPQPLARGKPAVMALESREAPQWALPAWGLVGASFTAVAAHALVATPRAPAAEFVDLRIADRVEPATASASSRSAAVRGNTPFVLGTETAGVEPWNDGFVASLGTLEGDHLGHGPAREGAGNLLATASFDGEQFSAGGLPSLEPAPGEASFAALPGEPESGGGGDSPSLAGKSPPASSSAPSALDATRPAQSALSNPAALGIPPASPSSTLSSGAETAALAQGLASSPTKGPSIQPTSGPGITPLSPPAVSGPGILAVGPDAGNAPVVRVYDPITLTLKFTINAYDATMTGGVRVAVGDVDGDGTPDIITAPGKGGGSLIKVWSGVDGSLLQSFNAYTPDQTDGVFVAAGDVNGDGHADIITGTDVGAKPLVKVFEGIDDSLLGSFISDPTAGANGVRVAAGDVTGSGHADIITGAGPGGPPRVTVVDGASFKPIYNFFPFNEDFSGGVYVSAGDLLGDGHADIVSARGGADIPEVSIWKGANLTPLGNFVLPSGSNDGIRVGVADILGTGQLDVVAAQGPGGGTLAAYNGNTLQLATGLFPDGPTYTGGLFVAGDAQPHKLVTPTSPSGSAPASASPTLGGSPPPSGPSHPPPRHKPDPVTVTVDKSNIFDTGTATFTASRTDTSTYITVPFTLGGNAVSGTDYTTGQSNFVFGIGQATATVGLMAMDDHKSGESKEEVVLTLSAGQGYTLGTPSSASVEIDEEPGPVIGNTCSCGGGTDLASTNPAVADNPAPGSSAAGVSYFDGVVKAGASFLGSSGFGVGWGVPLPEFPVTLAA